jgi:hypothetical protein
LRSSRLQNDKLLCEVAFPLRFVLATLLFRRRRKKSCFATYFQTSLKRRAV